MTNSVESNVGNQFVNIRVGVFFDGTGLNANTLLNKKNTDDYQFSNIYRLYKYYGSTEPVDQNTTLKVYVEGVGTISKNADVNPFAEAFGIDADDPGDEWGAFGKYKTGVQSSATQISTFLKSKSIKNCQLNIEFDVFGFSRGAATARHFTNKIAGHDQQLLQIINSAIEPYQCSLGSRPLVNFLGLFDTVTSMWTFPDKSPYIPKDPHDTGSTNKLEVNLPPNVARQVFQIRAMHECRYNYALSSLEGHYPELELAGCHSDIGGAYDANVEEMSEITEGRFPEWRASVQERLTKEVNSLKENKKWNVLLNKWTPEIYGYGVYGWAQVEKIVKGDLQYVALLVMLDCAQKYGCKFNQDILQYESKVQGDLQSYYQNALINMDHVLAGESGGIPQKLIDDLTEDYIHISSTWRLKGADDNPVTRFLELMVGNEESQNNPSDSNFNKLWTMRPDDGWNRKVYLNNQPL